jgi:hypothetical protein
MSSLEDRPAQLLEGFLQGLFDVLRHRSMVTVGPTDRLVDDRDRSIPGTLALRGNAHGLGRIAGPLGAFPQD